LALTLLKIHTMEVNWTVLGILAICAIVLIVYLVKRNLKDEKEVEKILNEEVKTDREFELDKDDEL